MKVCHAALTETERKIEILSGFNAAGEAITRPFDDTATGSEGIAPPPVREKKRVRSVSERSSPGANAAGSHASGSPDDSELDARRELF